MNVLLILLASIPLSVNSPHDLASLDNWGPYSKEHYGISHIEDIESGAMVEFRLVAGKYRRKVKDPSALYETGVHPWKVSPDMKHICYRHEIEWKDRVYVDATYHILNGNRVLLESHCVNNSDLVQNINLQLAVSQSTCRNGLWTLSINQPDNSFIVRYPGTDSWYGVAWDYPLSEVRQFRAGKLESIMPANSHDHVQKDFKGDMNGHYIANFLRPITIAPRKDTTILQLLVCGPREYVEEQMESFQNNGAGTAVSRTDSKYLPQAGGFALGEQLIEATLLTNVVYPINAYGRNIRHFCPGKNWNSLYTWDCGFIGWSMSELNPGLSYEIIRQYTTGPDEEAAFVHHGTPLATQILAIPDVLKNNNFDESLVNEIYPRLKRFYSYMTGPEFRMGSGLMATWKLFYNSGGWDDYPPQSYLTSHKDQRANTAPVVSTAYYLRCAKILRMLAAHLGLGKDVKSYDSDIRTLATALQRYSWDEEAGYFSYVVHDENGNASGIFRTGDGTNFNMGLDGVTPLVAGITTDAQEARLLSHIFTEGELWSDCGISTVDQRAPYYRIDGYWNGTVWMPHQMILWKTMLDLNLPERAWQIASTALAKWEQECSDSYNCYEYFIIESGRAGGWFNFSGLSSPMVNWFCSYFKPGTISTGFNAMVTKSEWNEDRTSVTASLEFDRDAVGKECAVLVCTTPGKAPHAFVDGKEVKADELYDGLLQLSVKATPRPMKIEIMR